jgi:hypothetical protein
MGRRRQPAPVQQGLQGRGTPQDRRSRAGGHAAHLAPGRRWYTPPWEAVSWRLRCCCPCAAPSPRWAAQFLCALASLLQLYVCGCPGLYRAVFHSKIPGVIPCAKCRSDTFIVVAIILLTCLSHVDILGSVRGTDVHHFNHLHPGYFLLFQCMYGSAVNQQCSTQSLSAPCRISSRSP